MGTLVTVGMRRRRGWLSLLTSCTSSLSQQSSMIIEVSRSLASSSRMTMSYGIQEYDKIPDDVMDLVLEYSKRDETPVSMKELMKTGRRELKGRSYKTEVTSGELDRHFASGKVLIQVSNFLRKELPVRLAHRIVDLDEVPLMRDMPSVQLVKGVYINSFVDIAQYEKIRTNEDENAFAHFLERKYEAHSSVLIQMARGAYELRQEIRQKRGSMTDADSLDSPEFSQMQECHAFLDRFYSSRIGIRVLAGQYLALRQPPLPNYIGMICLKTSPYFLVKQTSRDATQMCLREYGRAPDLEINGRCDLTFCYIPSYLRYMLLELLKNAMRATVERYKDSDERLPPVKVLIADDRENEDVVIKVADAGGGISRKNMGKIWSYLFTTADPRIQKNFIGARDHDPSSSPLAGLGFGLPISRSYARYFHGDLDIQSIEGYGTDAYLHLARMEDPQLEFS